MSYIVYVDFLNSGSLTLINKVFRTEEEAKKEVAFWRQNSFWSTYREE